jgi:hypothetical protein
VLRADARQEVVEVFGAVAAALAGGRAEGAIEPFDREMQGYDLLRRYFHALAEAFDTSSSVDVAEFEESAGKAEIRLRWLLRVTRPGMAMRLTDREQQVKAKLERRGKKWRVTALDPVEFFRPPE